MSLTTKTDVGRMIGVKSSAPPRNKDSFAKGGNPNPIGGTPRTDPGGKAYRDIDWALKTNERAVATNMALLSEFTNYGDWATDARRWPAMLYNRPIGTGLDYFINN